MKITNELLMDYLDGTLDEARHTAMELHLQSNADDAALVADIRSAQMALQEWNEAEPVRASDDFWIKVRTQLPAKPGRSSVGARVMGWLWPQQAGGFALPARVAALALAVVMALTLFSPRDATHTVNASPLSDSDRAFVAQSMQQHTAYVAIQPLSASDQALNDGRNGDGDGDDDDSQHGYTP